MKLFTEKRIKSIIIKNRIVMAPICTNLDLTTELAKKYYERIAKNNIGLIIIESTDIYNFQNEEYKKKLKALVNSIHDNNTKVLLQLKIPPHLPETNDLLSVSNYGNYKKISKDEIKIQIKYFVKAVKDCEDVGFDGIEIHGAHGYFLSRFFSPLYNKRKDKYGGDLKKRMAISVDLINEIRNNISNNFVIAYRLNATDNIIGGTEIKDAIKFAIELEKNGIDLLDVSAGIVSKSMPTPVPDSKFPIGTFVEYANKIKNEVNVPVISVGRIQTPEYAEKILCENKSDFVAIGRSLIADPLWANKALNDENNRITNCLCCNHCFDCIKNGNRIECLVNKDLIVGL